MRHHYFTEGVDILNQLDYFVEGDELETDELRIIKDQKLKELFTKDFVGIFDWRVIAL